MIAPTCNKCKKELTEFSAIIHGPPFIIQNVEDNIQREVTEKFHICNDCWVTLKHWVNLPSEITCPPCQALPICQSVNDIQLLKSKLTRCLNKEIPKPNGFIDKIIDQTNDKILLP